MYVIEKKYFLENLAVILNKQCAKLATMVSAISNPFVPTNIWTHK